MTTMLTGSESPESALRDLEFLARSIHRIRVLDRLAAEPIERNDVVEVTGVSRPTLSRILDDFEERGWVTRDGSRYRTTPLGGFVEREFTGTLERIAAVQGLGEVVQWFPEEGFGFDLARLAGAEIVASSKNDALAPTTHIVQRMRAADRVRVLTYTALPDCMEACWQRTVRGEGVFEGVFDPGALATLGSDPRMIAHAREMLDSGQAEVVCYGGEIPSVVVIVDDRVLLCLSGGTGAPHAVIETTDETVRSWAESTFDSYYREAEPLDPALLTA